MADEDEPVATFLYKNHRNVTSVRHVRDVQLGYGTTSYYPEPGFYLNGFDLDRQEERSFALKNIIVWKGSDHWMTSGLHVEIERMREALFAWGRWMRVDSYGGPELDEATKLMPGWAIPSEDV